MLVKQTHEGVLRKKHCLVFFFVGLLLFSLFLVETKSSYAEELPAFYRGIRPLGMGNAFIAVSDDENGLFYNPAGLKLESGEEGVGILNPLGEISEGSLDFYNDYSDLNTDNASEISAFLNDRIGEHQHLRVRLLPYIFVSPFAIGILAQATGDMEVRNPVFPEVASNLRTDIGVVVGGARDFGRGILGGMTVKYIQRDGLVKTYTAVDIASNTFDLGDDLKSNSDFSFDLGGMVHLSEWTTIDQWDLIAGIVLQNITDLDFKENGVHPMQLNLGAAIHPEIGFVKSTVALDFVDITQELGTDKDLLKRTHLGAEFKFPKIVSLRVGVNQGYFTGGVTFDFWVVRLDVATFSEELGAYAGQREDRRTLAQLSFGF